MNSHGLTVITRLLGLLLAVPPNLWAQPLLHHFSSISVSADGTVTLSLDGRVANTNHLLTPFPKPSGPFAVGTVDRVMVDPARTNLYRYQPATNAFMVTFWYPAEPPGAGVLPASAYDKRWAADPTVYTSHGYSSAWTNIASALVGHRFVGLPVAVNPDSYPVVLHSHGHTACWKLDSQRAEELASHGYVVVAPDHTDC